MADRHRGRRQPVRKIALLSIAVLVAGLLLGRLRPGREPHYLKARRAPRLARERFHPRRADHPLQRQAGTVPRQSVTAGELFLQDNLLENVNWAWGLSLIALTIAIHTMGVVMMALVGLRIRARLETRNLGFWHAILIVIGVVGTAGLLLAVLHGIEAAIWAAAYVWLGALNLPKDAILYSVDSMTTRGASGLMLEQHWRMMGALEAANGMLLFGISTAYIFAVMQVYWSMLSKQFMTPSPKMN